MNGLVFLAFGTVFAFSEFAIGTYILRNAPKLAARGNQPPAQLRLLGRCQIAMAVIILPLVLAVAFGLIAFGHIHPISL